MSAAILRNIPTALEREPRMPQETKVSDLDRSLLELAQTGIKPKALLKAVKHRHPKAKNEDIVHAAFWSLIAVADGDPPKADILQNSAIAERCGA